jgi:hypothetical protein
MTFRRTVPTACAFALVLSALACNFSAGAPAADQPPPPGDAIPDASSASGPGAPGGCANPLYPVAVGVTWTYALSGMSSDTFVRTIVAVDADGFTDQDVFSSGVTRTGEWRCDGGALIALTPTGGSNASVQTTGVNATFQTTALEGVTLPAAVNAGDSWTQDLTSEGTQTINGVEAASRNVVSYACTAGGTESVSVPAGTFDAVRVNCQVSMSITINMNGLEVPTQIESADSIWYAPGVGMVRTESVISGFGNSTIELTAYNIP